MFDMRSLLVDDDEDAASQCLRRDAEGPAVKRM
jgi:hypothetical protein